MKNNILTGVITFLCTFLIWILYLNFFESKNIDFHYFKRNFSKDQFLTFEKLTNKVSNYEYIDDIPSSDSIVEQEKKQINDQNDEYKLFINNFDLNKKIIKKVILPNSCNVLFYNKNRVYYTKNFILYKCLLNTNEIFSFPFSNLKINNLIFLKNKNEEIIIFGELKINEKYITGFFKVALNKLEIQLIKSIEINKSSSFLSNSLKYTGSFTQSFTNSLISFACEKYSRVYFFDNNGNYIKELVTNDKTPLPTILTNEKGDHFYSRGGTWIANKAAFIKNDYIYVFSAREKSLNKLILDKYSFNKLNYIESYKINCKNFSTNDITNLFLNENGLVLSFTTNYASLKFSR